MDDRDAFLRNDWFRAVAPRLSKAELLCSLALVFAGGEASTADIAQLTGKRVRNARAALGKLAKVGAATRTGGAKTDPRSRYRLVGELAGVERSLRVRSGETAEAPSSDRGDPSSAPLPPSSSDRGDPSSASPAPPSSDRIDPSTRIESILAPPATPNCISMDGFMDPSIPTLPSPSDTSPPPRGMDGILERITEAGKEPAPELLALAATFPRADRPGVARNYLARLIEVQGKPPPPLAVLELLATNDELRRYLRACLKNPACQMPLAAHPLAVTCLPDRFIEWIHEDRRHRLFVARGAALPLRAAGAPRTVAKGEQAAPDLVRELAQTLRAGGPIARPARAS